MSDREKWLEAARGSVDATADGSQIVFIGHSPFTPKEIGTADPTTCEHNSGWCVHADHEGEREHSGCFDCDTRWPFTTCGMTDEEIDQKMENQS